MPQKKNNRYWLLHQYLLTGNVTKVQLLDTNDSELKEMVKVLRLEAEKDRVKSEEETQRIIRSMEQQTQSLIEAFTRVEQHSKGQSSVSSE